MLRILHVFRAPLGGLFRHVLDLARGQVARGHEVGIFCDSTTGGARADQVLEALRPQLALGVTRVPMRRLPHPLDASGLLDLTRTYRRECPDVLHGHGSKGGLFSRLVTLPGRDRTTVRAYTPHGGSFNYNPGTIAHRLFMTAESALGHRTDVFLFESEYVKSRFDLFVGRTSRLVRVVHNGISEDEFLPVARSPEAFDLLYLGELRPAKGIDTLLDALATIRHQHGRRVTLMIVGSGPSGPELEARAKAAGIWDTVAFLPPQPIRLALAKAKVMVVPSRAESLPYVLLEAVAAATPLISTNVGGIPEIFGPRADELIPPGDVGILVDRILRKLDEPEDVRAEDAVSMSRQLRRGFRLDQMIDGVLRGYEDALSARGLVRTAPIISAELH